MKKLFSCALIILSAAPLLGTQKDSNDPLPAGHRLMIQNDTDHKLFLVENKHFKKLEPEEAVTLGWKKPLCNKGCTLAIYYGGNIPEAKPIITLNKGSRKRKTRGKREPSLIAQLKTNKAGIISLYYDKNGILKMDRVS